MIRRVLFAARMSVAVSLTVLAALAAVIAPTAARAQNWSVASIPDELKKDADAVVRLSETEFEYVSPLLSRERSTTVVTVLKRDGLGAANFQNYSDKFRSFSRFSGEIYDASGKLLRKIKNSELLYTDYSTSAFLDDTRTHYCQPNLPNPPFTVKYEWEITTKNAVWAFPPFVPQWAGSVGVERAEYRLKAPTDLKFYTKAYNFTPDYVTVPGKEGTVTHTWSVSDITPLPHEPWSKPSWEILPALYLSPDEFIYDGVAGRMDSWQGYATWQWQLLDRSSDVPAELKALVADLTEDASDDMEKIRILYDYLGRETRYVSIQIGIGGFQPMSIEEVYKTKYGDCKALSNLMRMMLAECGIPSYFVEIGVGRRSIPRDFASPAMSNHAILMVPMAADTLWVECTNPELPLGYRHDGIIGQNALVYIDRSAEVVTVPRYADSLNLSERRARVTLSADGSAVAHVATTGHIHRYSEIMGFRSANSDKRLNYLRSQVNIPVALISNPSYREEKSALPFNVIEYDLETPGLGSRTGERLFVPVMTFRKPLSFRFPRTARKGDICNREGDYDVDITELVLPAGVFEVEALPPPVSLDNKYGAYSMVCRPTDEGIEIERRLLLRTGTYDVGEFDAFREFIDAVTKYDNAKIVLKNAAK